MIMSRSKDLLSRALVRIPEGTQTASKAARRFIGPGDVTPAFIERGRGAYLWDVDGNRWLDTTSALGAVILGYGDRRVNKAARAQVDRGPLFTLPGELEVSVAEELLQHWVPAMSYVRFFKTGSEALSAAIRLARAVTGRSRIAIVRPGYHGWHDWFIASQEPAHGVTAAARRDIEVIPRGDFCRLADVLCDKDRPCAALVMEPWSPELVETVDYMIMSRNAKAFAVGARTLCNETGTLLIFDEVLSGIRAGPTVASYLNLKPDLIALGKALANGYPLAVLAGTHVMQRLNQDDVFVSGTYAGELVSLAVCQATLQALREDGKRALVAIHRWGDTYLRAVQKILPPQGTVYGCPWRFVIQWTAQVYADLWQQECARRGVLYTGGHNITLAHAQQAVMDHLLGVYAQVARVFAGITSVDDAEAKLAAPLTRPAFRRQ